MGEMKKSLKPLCLGIDKFKTLVFLCSRTKKNCYARVLFWEKVLLSKRVDVEHYKHLEIKEKGNISHNEMKVRTKKEYFKRVTAALESKLNGEHVLKAIKTWAFDCH